MMVLTVGLSLRKGTDIVIRAFADVLKQFPHARLVVVGSGPRIAAPFQELVRLLNINSQVDFYHDISRSKLDRLYDLCDVFILTPRYIDHFFEGYGLVYLEAGLHKKPVIGSRSGGVPDAVIDGKTGLLVPENDPSAAAHALITIFHDSKLRVRLGEANYQLAKERNWDSYIKKIIPFYLKYQA